MAQLPRYRTAALFLCAGFAAQAAPNLPPTNFEIVTLSNRADLISGGNALVEVRVPQTVPLHHVKLIHRVKNQPDRDVTSSFVTDTAERTMRGVVTGLANGENQLLADSNGQGRGRPRARLTITNHPIGGPVLSGPQIVPYVCATPLPRLDPATGATTNASGLKGEPSGTQCNIASEFRLWYRTTAAGCSLNLPDANNPPANPCFKAYTAGAPTPPDLANVPGTTTPYIVRVERGTMNRGIYDLAVLFDPSQPWSALAPQTQWSGKVLYQFGASTGQPRRQARTTSNWTSAELALVNGYLVAQNSMTDSALNSNRVAMAETVMMMKEHIGDTYGPIKFTMGSGCSGGSINSNMNASIAPGQLDGITISCAYPDSETTGMEVSDCVLLAEAYIKPQWTGLMAGLSQAQINAKKAAINGHPDQTACHGWYNAFGSNGKVGNYQQRLVSNVNGTIVTSPTVTNNCQLPTSQVYDPAFPNDPANQARPRCSAWDWATAIWGKAPDGFRTRETRDNVGIQYGLKALQSGAITPDEFVTLNEIIGGIDKDSNLQAARSIADPNALEIAYRAGIVMSGHQVAKTAVIDMRGWDDSQINRPPGVPSALAIHYQWRSFGIRDRLDKDFGDHGNQVMWRFARNGLGPSTQMQTEAFTTMDLWLTTLKADTSDTSLEAKVRSAKPASAFDYCLLTSDVEQDDRVTNQAACDADPFLKPGSSPRQVAGGPRSEEILKCRLKPLNPADYAPASLTSAQLTRLQAVFPGGVCDWAAGGVGQQPALSPLDFSAGPGGVPLPPAPVSEAAPER
jgi:uncharacterized tannase-like protein DUF6351